jgi:hypothetical protein
VALGNLASTGNDHGFAVRKDGGMPTYLVFHEVDDVEHWRNMPTRDEFFGALGITQRIFKDPQGSNRVGLILEIPDFSKFQQAMQSDQAAEAMKRDGVHPDTLLVLEAA